MKINRGSYPAIPTNYSKDIKDLLAEMLTKDPTKRPSMRKILEKPIVSKRISRLLAPKIRREELTETFIDKYINPLKEEEEEKKQSRDLQDRKFKLSDDHRK